MDIRVINDRSQWNTFIAQQPNAGQLRTFEWSEMQHLRGNITYRLGAFEAEQLVGVMLLVIATLPVSMLDLKYMYSTSRLHATGRDAAVLAVLVAEAHTIARREHVITFRLQPDLPLHGSQLESWLNSTKPKGITISSAYGEDRHHPMYDYVYRSSLYTMWAMAARLHHLRHTRPGAPQQPLPSPAQTVHLHLH